MFFLLITIKHNSLTYLVRVPISGGKVDNRLEYKYNSVREEATSLTEGGRVLMLDLERFNLVRPSSLHLLNSRDKSYKKVIQTLRLVKRWHWLILYKFGFSTRSNCIKVTYHIWSWHNFWRFFASRVFGFSIDCYHNTFLFGNRTRTTFILLFLKIEKHIR